MNNLLLVSRKLYKRVSISNIYSNILFSTKFFTKYSDTKINDNYLQKTQIGSLQTLIDQGGIDLYIYVLLFLDYPDLNKISLVSKKMNYYSCTDLVWKSLINRYGYEVEKNFKYPLKQLFFSLLKSEYKWTTKIDTLKVSNKGLNIKRTGDSGCNPAALAQLPLNRRKNTFMIKIISRGTWIGIGIADLKFVTHHSSTLGTQACGINSAFFCQDSTLLQLNSCKKRSSISNKLVQNDIIKVKINFDLHSILYFRNNLFEGELVSDTNFIENEIFPACNLSHGSEVQIICPLLTSYY